MKTIRVKYCDGYGVPGFIDEVLKKHYEVVESDDPQFVFYSVCGYEHLRWPKAVRVFYSEECCVPDFRYCDYAISYDRMDYGERYCRLPYYYGIEKYSSALPDEQELLNRKFCNFVYSNASRGEGAGLRIGFCQKLAEYKFIECPGKVLHNIDNAIEPRGGDWQAGKLRYLSDFKFTIAFENGCYPGYTTEKLIHPLMAHSLPIYWGNSEVGQEFNTAAFLNAADYDYDLDRLLQRVIELDQDDEQYLAMLRQPIFAPGFDYGATLERLERFLCRIVERGRGFDRDPMGFAAYSMLCDFTAGELARELARRAAPTGLKAALKRLKR